MAERHVKSAGVIRKVAKRYVKVAGVIREIQKRYVKVAGVAQLVFQNALTLTIAADATDYNARTAALAVGWNGTDIVNVILTTNAGIYTRPSTTSTFGIDTGTPWPGGSTFKWINHGYDQGKGGAGGTAGFSQAGGNGLPGGDALNLGIDVSIDNSDGYILGGGGGGGGGGSGQA